MNLAKGRSKDGCLGKSTAEYWHKNVGILGMKYSQDQFLYINLGEYNLHTTLLSLTQPVLKLG